MPRPVTADCDGEDQEKWFPKRRETAGWLKLLLNAHSVGHISRHQAGVSRMSPRPWVKSNCPAVLSLAEVESLLPFGSRFAVIIR